MKPSLIDFKAIKAKCPECGWTKEFPEPIGGEPQFWCFSCTMQGREVEMRIISRKAKPK
jgi:hypothetical protein